MAPRTDSDKSVETKPETTTSSRRNPNRKWKERKQVVMSETKLEEGLRVQDKNSSPHTILNVPQYAQTGCTETTVSDVTDLDESLPANR